MTNFQKAFCVFLSLCFFVVLAFMPEPFYHRGNVYRQVPLYCFLEKKATVAPPDADPETRALLTEQNGDYLAGLVKEENNQEGNGEETGEQASAGAGKRGDAGEESKRGKEMSDGTMDGGTKNDEIENDGIENGETTNSETKNDGTRNGETKNNETKSDGTKNGETKNNETKSDGAKNGETKNGETKNDGTKNGETKSNGTKNGEMKNDGTKSDGTTKGKTKNSESGNDEIMNEEAANSNTANGGTANSGTANGEIPASVQPHPEIDLSMEALADYDYLLGSFFIVDENTATNQEQLNAARFLEKDLTMEKSTEAPQILIYHSHSQETFADSREGMPEDTIVGVGDYLTELLTDTYGYQVLHVTESFDIVDGELDRSKAYDYARDYIEKVLEENPSIEVLIDLHRDGVDESRHLVTEINGKETAQVMFYNGLSYTVANGPVTYLPNPYIQDNLAFSFQMEYQASQYYPGFTRGIYLAGLRYNLDLKPRAVLLEAGAQTNTVQEVKNAMEPFADILNRVLKSGNRT